MTLNPGDRVAVTGAAGFIGAAVTRALLARGADVVAIIEPGGDTHNLDGLPVTKVTADVRDPTALNTAFDGARYAFHIAALYAFWAPDPTAFADINITGTRNVLAAAAQCEKIVYTSTVGVIGLHGTGTGTPADETAYADVTHLFGHYKQTKYVAEHEVLRAAAEGLPISLALPTYPVGPGDRRPTPTGRMILDYLNGQIPAYVDTGFNVAHVDDLAAGHLLALEHGTVGRSYIFGGENMSMAALLATLAELTGLPAPTRQVPAALTLTAARISELVEGRLLRREPHVPLEGARMATTRMLFDDRRARTELGYTSRPARAALAASVDWFVGQDRVNDARRARIQRTD